MLGRPGLPQGEDTAADRDLPPQAWTRVLGEAMVRVHHQHAIGGESVHLAIRRPPLGRLLLQTAPQRGLIKGEVAPPLSGRYSKPVRITGDRSEPGLSQNMSKIYFKFL